MGGEATLTSKGQTDHPEGCARSARAEAGRYHRLDSGRRPSHRHAAQPATLPTWPVSWAIRPEARQRSRKSMPPSAKPSAGMPPAGTIAERMPREADRHRHQHLAADGPERRPRPARQGARLRCRPERTEPGLRQPARADGVCLGVVVALPAIEAAGGGRRSSACSMSNPSPSRTSMRWCGRSSARTSPRSTSPTP